MVCFDISVGRIASWASWAPLALPLKFLGVLYSLPKEFDISSSAACFASLERLTLSVLI